MASLVKRGSVAGVDGSGWSGPLNGVVIFVVALSLISIAVPVATIGIEVERSYNEGWNAYHAARVAAGGPLYTGDPARLVTYPFLSFYLIAWLKPVFGNVLMIGRGLNLAAFAMTALLSSLIIRRLGGGLIEMLFGAVCVIGFQAVQAREWIAADEPQMLAEALMLSGLLCYVSGPGHARRLAICALLFAAGGFTKQILVAIPLAVSLDLLCRDRRQFLVWCACSAAALLLFVGLSEALVGTGAWSEIFFPRAYHWRSVVYHARKLAIAFKWPMLGCLIYLVRSLPGPQRILLRAYGANALLSAAIFSGGFGVAENIYLDFAVFMGLTAGLMLGRLREAVSTATTRLHYALPAVILFALPVITRSPYCGSRPLDFDAAVIDYREKNDKIDAVEALLHDTAGPALCDNLLVCFEAGKPLIDLYALNSQSLANRLDASGLVGEIRHHRFSLIELGAPLHSDPREPSRFTPYLLNQGRFSERTLQAIDESYEPIAGVDGAVLLAPRTNRNPEPAVRQNIETLNLSTSTPMPTH